MGRTVTFFTGLGTGLAIENYSNQLRYFLYPWIKHKTDFSAPYITPATVSVESKPLLLTDTALPLGSVWEAVKSLSSPSAEKPAEKPAEPVAEEPAQETSQDATPEAESVVEAVLESVEESVEKVLDQAEEVIDGGNWF